MWSPEASDKTRESEELKDFFHTFVPFKFKFIFVQGAGFGPPLLFYSPHRCIMQPEAMGDDGFSVTWWAGR